MKTTKLGLRRPPLLQRIRSRRRRYRRVVFETLESRRVLAPLWQNPLISVDVTQDGVITPFDAAVIVSRLALRGSGALPATRRPSDLFFDVDGDGILKPFDAARVISSLVSGLSLPINLIEGDPFARERSITIGVGQDDGARKYRFEIHTFYGAASPELLLDDLLAVYVLPAVGGGTLLDRGTAGTSIFSLKRNGTAEYPPGLVQFDGRFVDIDLTSLYDQQNAQLLFQLLSGGSQQGTRIAIRPVSNEVAVNGAAAPQFTAASPPLAPGGALDVDSLQPSGLTLVAELSNARFSSRSNRLLADLRVRNSGTAVGRQVAVVFPGLPAGVQLRNASGVTSSGEPYVNLLPAIRPGGLQRGAVSSPVLLDFAAPSGTRFGLQPTILSAGTNQAPVFAPMGTLQTQPGQVLTVPLSATDPDGDLVTFQLDTSRPLPTGMLTGDEKLKFTPTPAELGTYTLSLFASDGTHQVNQQVTLHVQADPQTTTRLSGRVLDVDGTPLSGIPIGLNRVTVMTDSQGDFTLSLPSLQLPAESFNIPVPPGDVHFDPLQTGTQSINFRRARFDPLTGTSVNNPRRHPNLISSFLDAGVVYGSDAGRAMALRTFQGGLLKTLASPHGPLPPQNNLSFFPAGPLENDSAGPVNPTALFVAGDVRSSENPALTALHTLLLREHNRLAAAIAADEPSLNDEQIYQRARRLVGGLVQHITYQEFLPLLLGANAIPAYTGYDAGVNPEVGSFFTTAAFRFGHSQLVNTLFRLDAGGNEIGNGHLPLRQSFFNPQPILDDGIDPILRGLVAQQAEKIDTQIIDELRNMLFGPPGSGGSDLPAMSIQRGRDMGLPPYNQMRQVFGLAPANSFADISSDPTVQAALAAAYDDVQQVDVFVGGLAEDHAAGAIVGPLFQAAIADQFRRTRDGDRFWYENQQFTDDELTLIRGTTLAELIQRNTAISGLPANVFTTGAAPAGPPPAGSSAPAIPAEFRTFDGSNNHPQDPPRGSAGRHLQLDAPHDYGDGISAPAGQDRAGARAISNAVLPQNGSQPNGVGATMMSVFWGQLVSHDLALTPAGTSDVLRIVGDQAPINGKHYPFVAEKLSLLLERPLHPGVENVVERPIFLPPIDVENAVKVDPNQQTLVTTPRLPGASLTIAAGTLEDRSGQLFSDDASITEVPVALTPAALPPQLFPNLVVTIQPAELVFTTPAPLSLPNPGYPPGTIMDLWSINPNTGFFDIVGVGRVSPDGSVIDTVSGGIRNSSWHFFTPPPPDPKDPQQDPRNQDKRCSSCSGGIVGGSEVLLHSGELVEWHDLASYQSLGEVTGWRLVYSSLRADPRPIVNFGFDSTPRTPNTRMVAQLAVRRGSFSQQLPGGKVTRTTASGDTITLIDNAHFWLPPAQAAFDGALQVDLSMQPTGRYEYELTAGLVNVTGTQGVDAQITGSSTTLTGELLHVNSIQSPFGAGWGLRGLQQLIPNPDGSLLLVDGGNEELLFGPPGGPGQSFVSPPGDFSQLTQLADGSFVRTFPNQETFIYDDQGRIVSRRDRNGNTLQFQYDASGNLTKLIDPVGLETTFSYFDGRVSSISDPAGRQTRLVYNSDGHLTRIIDPDNSSRNFEYDAQHRMVAEINQRGHREQATYGFHGRVLNTLRKDGSTIQINPVQVHGLRPPELTVDAFQSPVAPVNGDPDVPTVAANGNVTTTRLDQAGQIVSSADALGGLPSVSRSSNNLIIRRTDARGNLTVFSYDARGNLLTVQDQLTAGGSILGTITEPGERDVYTFAGAIGDRLFLDGLEGDSILYSLIGPDGVMIDNNTAAQDGGPWTLVQDGPYRLELAGIGDAVGDYRFRLLDAAEFPVLVPGQVESVLLNTVAGDVEVFRFPASAGDQILVTSQSVSQPFATNWAIIGPGNQQLDADFADDDLQITAPVDGTYFVALRGQPGPPNNVSFSLTQMPSPPQAAGGLNVVHSGTILPGQLDGFSFSAPAGQLIFFDGQLDENFSLQAAIQAPSGNVVVAAPLSGDVGPITLPESGQYSVTVSGINASSSGQYRFRVAGLGAAAPASIVSGQLVGGNLGDLDVDIYGFAGAIGQQIFVDFHNAGFSPRFDLISPSGAPVTWFDDPSEFGPVALLENGDYSLLVYDPFGGPWNYTLRYQDVGQAAQLAFGTQVTGSIAPGDEVDFFRFSGQQGQTIVLNGLFLGDEGAIYSLAGFPASEPLRPEPHPLGSEVTLPATGEYILGIFSPVMLPLTYQFQALVKQQTTTQLDLGQVVTASFSGPSQQHDFLFNGLAGQRVYLDGFKGSSTGMLGHLRGPDGRFIAADLFPRLDGFDDDGDDAEGFGDFGLMCLSQTGIYNMSLFSSTAGTFPFRLLDVNRTPLISPGGVTGGMLNPGDSADVYRFNGSAGQRIFLDFLSSTAGAKGSWKILSPDTSVLEDGQLPVGLDAVLPFTGEYVIAIVGEDPATPIQYNFQLLLPGLVTESISLGSIVSRTINAAGDRHEFTFQGTAGQKVFVDALSSSDPRIAAQLLPPSIGSTFEEEDGVFFAVIGEDDDEDDESRLDLAPRTLRETGTYRISVLGGAANSFSFRALDVTSAPLLPLGATVNQTFNPGLRAEVFRFQATAGQRLLLDSLSVSQPNAGTWYVVGPDDEVLAETTLDQDLTITFPVAGFYEIVLAGDLAGDSFTHSFQAGDVSEAPVPTSNFGVEISGTLNPGETADFQATAPAGLMVYFDSLDPSSVDLEVDLLGPGNELLATANSSADAGPFVTPRSGTYTARVRGKQPGSQGGFRFRFVDVRAAATDVTGVVNGSLNPGQGTDVFSFSGTAGDAIYFDSLVTGDFGPGTPELLVVGPSGNPIGESFLTGIDAGPFVMRETGKHFVLIRGQSDASQNYAFQLLPLSGVAELNPGDIVNGQLDPGRATAIFRFSGSAGQRMYFDTQSQSPLFSSHWEVLDLRGRRLAGRNMTDDFDVTLQRSGDHLLVLSGQESFQPVNFTFQFVVPPAIQSAPLTLGAVEQVAFTAAGERAEFTFTGFAGQRVVLDALSSDNPGLDLNAPRVDILDPNGQFLFRGPFAQLSDKVTRDSQPLRLNQNGAYRLVILAGKAETIRFRFLDVDTAARVIVGVPLNGQLNQGLAADVYRVEAVAGERLRFEFSTTSFLNPPLLSLFDQSGTPVAEDNANRLMHDVSRGGSFVLVVHNQDAAPAGDYTLERKRPPVQTLPIVPGAAADTRIRLTYDAAFSRLTSRTDELGRQTLYQVDPANGNWLSITRVVGTPGGGDDIVTTFTYRPDGQIETETDSLGRVTRYEYDLLGRRIKETRAEGTLDQAVRRFEYDAAGNRTALVDENGNRTEFEYDAMNRLVAQRDPLGQEARFAYDAAGNRVSAANALNEVTQFHYDPMHRLQQVVDPQGNTTQFEYDANGNLRRTIDPLGNASVSVYDARNRRTEQIAPDGGKTSYRYDADGNLIQLTDPVGNATQFQYDARSRTVRRVDPLGAETRFDYDLANNRVQTTDRLSRTTRWTYDDLDRVVGEQWLNADGSLANTIQFTYDAVGNLTSLMDQFSSLAYTYDALNRVRTVDNAGTPDAPQVLISYSYDAAGNVLTVSDNIGGAGGATTAYAYDARHLLSQITQTGSGAEKRVDFAYDGLGRFDNLARFADTAGTLPVVASSFQYDSIGRLVSLSHDNAVGNVAFYNYVYDAAGRITQLTDVDGTVSYAYDARDQLVGAQYSNPQRTDELYVYDANGNRVQSHLHGGAYQTGAGNRLLSDGTFDYSYDLEGNLVQRRDRASGAERDLVYDHRNRLVAIIDRDGSGTEVQRVKYSYDATGRRTSKNVATATDEVLTHFVYDRDDVILDFVDPDGAGGPALPAVAARYYHGPAVDQVLAQEDSNGIVQWLLTNHLGTVTDVVGNQGVLQHHSQYDSFGNDLHTSNASPVRYGFTGRERDVETSAYHFRQRAYDSSIGRFLREDPLESDANLYRYAENNPLINVDPTGEAAGFAGLAIGLVAVTIIDAFQAGLYGIAYTLDASRGAQPFPVDQLRLDSLQPLDASLRSCPVGPAFNVPPPATIGPPQPRRGPSPLPRRQPDLPDERRPFFPIKFPPKRLRR
jgi:RHS repeat-associated protein